MPVGFQSFRQDDKVVQIDSDYFNFEFVRKGVFSLGPTNTNDELNPTVDISYTGTMPIMAVSSTDLVISGLTAQNGNTYTFSISNTSGSTISGEYFIFDKPTASGASSGFQLFNAAGQLTFCASKKYARILDYWEATLAEESSGSLYPRTYSSAGKVAFVQCEFGYTVTEQLSPNDPRPESNIRLRDIRMTSARSANNTFYLQRVVTYYRLDALYTGRSVSNVAGPAKFLLLDVTYL